MKTYGAAATADPFARTRRCFEDLIGQLSGERAARMTHEKLEELIETRGREAQRQLLQDHLDLRALREEQALIAAGHAVGVQGRRRIERGHERRLATVVGTVTVRRLAFRAPGQSNIYPADAALSLPKRRHSLGLRRLAVTEAVRGSYDTAKTAIERRCGAVAGKRQLEQLVRAAAVDVAAFYSARIPMPSTREELLVISADAKGIVMRPDSLRPHTAKAAAGKKRGRGIFRTRLASGEKPCRKRMATVACVYDAAPAPRRPHDVIEVPGGRSGNRQVRRGPHAARKWLTASVERDAAQVIEAAFDQAEARDAAHARTWVVLVDGDRHQIELIETEARRRSVTVHLVIDLVHVLEYLWSAAWCFFAKDDPAAEDWVAEHALAILRGRSAQMASSITKQADEHRLAADRHSGVKECVHYLENKEPYLRYDQALEQGWPIATGVVEGACRHLIADRFDITGSRWSVEGAEAVLALRAVIDNGDFDEYWQFHAARERERLYPGAEQGDYVLGA
ncbi:ISKra4 family transposase [Streptomyces sp. NPDC002845]